MRARSTQDDRLFAAQKQATYLRIDVQDPGGTWRDLTARRNYNFVASAQIKFDPDTPAASMDATVKREIYSLSLAPAVTKSVLNSLGGGTQLVRLNASVRAYVQVRPAGMPPDNTGHVGDDGNAGKWTLVFDGQIDAHDSGSDPLTINCSDLVTRLQRAWIKADRIYGMWQGARRVLAGTVVVATSAAANGANNIDAATGPWWQAQSTFTTGATEPAWPASPTPGTTLVSDNGGTWKCVVGPTGTPLETHIQQLLDDNLGVGAWSLYTPTASSEVIRPYTQSGMSVYQAIQNTADIIGWLVRWRWDDGTGQFRLTFFDPGRSNTTSLYTIGPAQYLPITEFKQDLTNVRNDVDVRYSDATVLDADGNPTPSTVNSQDAASIAQNDDLYAAIAEGAATAVQTAATAQKLADAACSDLAQPPVTTQVEINLAWWFDIADVITLSANGLQFDTDQKLAVFGVELDIDGRKASTILSLRSKPSSGHTRWAGKFAAPGRNGGAVKTLNPFSPLGVSVVPALRGARVSFSIPSNKQDRYDFSELHISTVNGFTPSSATLKAVGRTGHFLLGDLTPGTTYYCRVVHKDRRGNPSSSSAQSSFVADSVGSTDLDAFMRSGGKYVVSADQAIASDTAVAFDTTPVFDAQAQLVATSGGTQFRPVASGVWKIHVRLRLEDDGTGALSAGSVARVVIYDRTSGVATRGPECVAVSDIGSAGAPTKVAIIAEFKDSIAVVGGPPGTGHIYEVRFELPYFFTAGGIGSVHTFIGLASSKVKAPYTYTTDGGSTYDVQGGYIEFAPVPQ